MAFSDSVIAQAWNKAGGKCNRCDKDLVWGNRGKDGMKGAWEAHHKLSVASGGQDILSNCEILCVDCHSKTKSYGRH